MSPSLLWISLITSIPLILADGVDWIRPDYLIEIKTKPPLADTSASQSHIFALADSRSKAGPWSVTNGSVLSGSGNPHDYLSWAPYYWPDCNWCSSSSTSSSSKRQLVDANALANLLGKLGIGNQEPNIIPNPLPDIPTNRSDSLLANSPTRTVQSHPSSIFAITFTPTPTPPSNDQTSVGPYLVIPLVQAHTTSTVSIDGNPQPTNRQGGGSKSTSSCRPSPTTRMAPSATWTTCPYQRRDGDRNPDLDTLKNGQAMNPMVQSSFYNAIAFALSSFSKREYAQRAVLAIDTWFINPKTSMTPHMKFAQVIRGPPGNQHGSFMGVLDARVLIQAMNALLILKASNTQYWTPSQEKSMQTWVGQYSEWILHSDQGQKAATSPNNHGTWWMAQMVALRIYRDDLKGARSVVEYYFSHQFQDQLTASGEQPFEAVRNHPFHYRCFNLEAMIALAKLADYLDMNVWTARSKYGATIQTAADYLMRIDPGKDDPSQLFPHLTTVAAAYGDPTGKYTKYVTKRMATNEQDGSKAMKKAAWWLYDQPEAFKSSPAATKKTATPSSNPKSSSRSRRSFTEASPPTTETSYSPPSVHFATSHSLKRSFFFTSPQSGQMIPPTSQSFEPEAADEDEDIKPEVFKMHDRVVLDEGVDVTWQQVKPYYKYQMVNKASSDTVGEIGYDGNSGQSPFMWQDAPTTTQNPLLPTSKRRKGSTRRLSLDH